MRNVVKEILISLGVRLGNLIIRRIKKDLGNGLIETNDWIMTFIYEDSLMELELTKDLLSLFRYDDGDIVDLHKEELADTTEEKLREVIKEFINRKEVTTMSDLELYMRDLSLEAETTQDIMTAHLREAVRVLSLVVKDVEFKVEGYFEAFSLSVKFDDYLNQTRYVQFKVTKNQRAWNITYRIYSYSDFLRERTIETNSTLELQTFIRTVLKEDLVLELDSNIVE